eukprot:SAG22_NODE_641_length_8235_cov_9.502704_2_plen_106_part_00
MFMYTHEIEFSWTHFEDTSNATAQTGSRTTAGRMDLAAELAEFRKEQEAIRKEQEAKQAAEFAAFQEELKKRQDAAAAADPNPGFAQSYVDEKLREQGNQHGKAE